MENINEQNLTNWENKEEWNSFYKSYYPYLKNMAISCKLPSQDAEDVVQDVLISMAKQFRDQKFTSEKGAFHAWVTKFAKWRIIDIVRKNKIRSNLITSGDDFLMECQADSSPSIDEKYKIAHQREIVKQAVKNFKGNKKSKEYHIFYDFFIQNMSQEEIAAKYKTNMNNIYLAKHRVLKRLKKDIKSIDGVKYAY